MNYMTLSLIVLLFSNFSRDAYSAAAQEYFEQAQNVGFAFGLSGNRRATIYANGQFAVSNQNAFKMGQRKLSPVKHAQSLGDDHVIYGTQDGQLTVVSFKEGIPYSFGVSTDRKTLEGLVVLKHACKGNSMPRVAIAGDDDTLMAKYSYSVIVVDLTRRERYFYRTYRTNTRIITRSAQDSLGDTLENVLHKRTLFDLRTGLPTLDPLSDDYAQRRWVPCERDEIVQALVRSAQPEEKKE